MKRSKSKAKVLIIILLAAAAAGGFYFYAQLSNGGVVLEVKVPDGEVEIGTPFDVEVIFTNNTGNTLGNVRLSFNFTKDLVSREDGSSSIETRELGEISDGRVHRETFQVVAIPSQDPDYKTSVTALYAPVALVAEFKKSKEVDVRVKKPDYGLDLQVPARVFSGEEFNIKASYERDDEVPKLAEFEVHIDYPQDFKVVSSNPEETDMASDGVRFRNIDKDEDEGEVSVRGKVELPDSTNFSVIARLVMRIFGEEHTFVSETKNVIVEPSPLTFQVLLGDREEIVRPGEEIIYVLLYRNNTSVDLQDVIVRAQLIGDMFDTDTLETDARFSSFNNTLTWDSRNFDELEKLGAGQDGQLSFKIKVRERHPIRKLNDKDFTLVVDARIESPTVPFLIDADKTLNTSRLESKVAGRIEVNAIGLFRDAQSGIVNTGPFPPRAGTPTNYTIHWRISNFGTDVDEVEVRVRLADGVTFTGITKGNTGDVAKIDPATGEIVWRVGRLLATTGILNEKPETIFQIQATPNGSQVGDYMTLVETTNVIAHDEFTDITIAGSDSPITSRLPDDPTVNVDNGKVVQ